MPTIALLESPTLSVDLEHGTRINAELLDEIEAINAIYGNSTLTITSSKRSDPVCLLRLDDQAFSFEICFPSSYPTQAPQVTGIDPLRMSQSRKAKKLRSTLEQLLLKHFTPGSVCIYDTLEALRAEIDSDPADSKPTTPFVVQVESLSLPSSDQVINIDDWKATGQCVACLEHYLSIDLVVVKCRHSYCPDCLQSGLESCISAKTPFTCCGKWLSVTVLGQYCIFPAQVFEKYLDFLLELGAETPIFCSNRRCSRFLASATSLGRGVDNIKCSHCRYLTCSHCRKGGHSGVCREDTAVQGLLDGLLQKGSAQFYSKYHLLVEKNGGCSHMTCRCGYKWCWKCGASRERASEGYTCGCSMF